MSRSAKVRRPALPPAGTPAKSPDVLFSTLRRCWESAPTSAKSWMMKLSQLQSAETLPGGSEDLPFALKELLKGAGARDVPALDVGGVNADSRAISAGEAFFALPGTRVHGDSFAA